MWKRTPEISITDNQYKARSHTTVTNAINKWYKYSLHVCMGT